MTTRFEDVTEGYDKREARLIHAAASQLYEPDEEAALNAARRLVTAIEVLDKEVTSLRREIGKFRGELFRLGDTLLHSFRWPTLIYADRFEVTIYLERGDLFLAARRESVDLGKKKIPNLFFNPIENRFEGTEYDTSIVQEPGSRRAKRSGLAVVMEAAAGALADVMSDKFKPDFPVR